VFEKLRKIREQHNATCEQLSNLLGFKTRGAYQKKETGNVPFTLDEAKKISDYFQIDIQDIFFENEVSYKETN
jgi:DNA-binding XRE family transcriptional regulator